MDVRIALFIHVISVATWFGGTALMAMVLRNAIRMQDQEGMTKALAQAHRWNLTMFIPTAVLVLATGIYMLLKIGMGEQPLWLLVKERAGSGFIVLFILVITLYGAQLLKKAEKENTAKMVKRYILLLNLSLLIMTILILFVTLKFS